MLNYIKIIVACLPLLACSHLASKTTNEYQTQNITTNPINQINQTLANKQGKKMNMLDEIYALPTPYGRTSYDVDKLVEKYIHWTMSEEQIHSILKSYGFLFNNYQGTTYFYLEKGLPMMTVAPTIITIKITFQGSKVMSSIIGNYAANR